jgi:hypothetical protein
MQNAQSIGLRAKSNGRISEPRAMIIEYRG